MVKVFDDLTSIVGTLQTTHANIFVDNLLIDILDLSKKNKHTKTRCFVVI